MSAAATRRGGASAAPDGGSQALEFALIVPVLLVVLSVAAVAVGRVAVDKVRAEHLAAEAARAVASQPHPGSPPDHDLADVLGLDDEVAITVHHDGPVVTATVEIVTPLPWGSHVVVGAQAASWREPAA